VNSLRTSSEHGDVANICTQVEYVSRGGLSLGVIFIDITVISFVTIAKHSRT